MGFETKIVVNDKKMVAKGVWGRRRRTRLLGCRARFQRDLDESGARCSSLVDRHFQPSNPGTKSAQQGFMAASLQVIYNHAKPGNQSCVQIQGLFRSDPVIVRPADAMPFTRIT